MRRCHCQPRHGGELLSLWAVTWMKSTWNETKRTWGLCLGHPWPTESLVNCWFCCVPLKVEPLVQWFCVDFTWFHTPGSRPWTSRSMRCREIIQMQGISDPGRGRPSGQKTSHDSHGRVCSRGSALLSFPLLMQPLGYQGNYLNDTFDFFCIWLLWAQHLSATRMILIDIHSEFKQFNWPFFQILLECGNVEHTAASGEKETWGADRLLAKYWPTGWAWKSRERDAF